jgi:hypothetical protein
MFATERESFRFLTGQKPSCLSSRSRAGLASEPDDLPHLSAAAVVQIASKLTANDATLLAGTRPICGRCSTSTERSRFDQTRALQARTSTISALPRRRPASPLLQAGRSARSIDSKPLLVDFLIGVFACRGANSKTASQSSGPRLRSLDDGIGGILPFCILYFARRPTSRCRASADRFPSRHRTYYSNSSLAIRPSMSLGSRIPSVPDISPTLISFRP